MGKISILTQKQKIILEELKNYPEIVNRYYFTGGTALAEYYLRHRLSEDLDFFSEEKLDAQIHGNFIAQLVKKYSLERESSFIDPVNIHLLTFSDGEMVKVDFSYYPYLRLAQGKKVNGLVIDSLLDLAVNKLSTIMQRQEMKDFVDLYFLMNKFSFWDLKEGVRRKFRMDLEPFLVAGACARVEDFENMPILLKPLTLQQLKTFYRQQAIELGKMAVEE